MTELKDRYASVILEDLLRVGKTDVLSINTEEADFDFARIIALKAVEMTGVPVKIVQTDNGRPVDVIEFDPQFTSAVQPARPAMLRLAHKAMAVVEEGPTLDVVVDGEDFATLQKLGHLAQPVVLDRRISVPWCCVPVYEDKDPRWSEISSMISESPVSDSALVTDYRKKMLSEGHFVQMRIVCEGTDLVIGLPAYNRCCGGTQVLSGGRSFLSGTDFQNISFNADCTKADGRVEAEAVVFGKRINVGLEFKDGVVVSHNGPQSLERFFGYDELARRCGYITVADRILHINLGGALSESLEDVPETEEELPDFFNRCFYSLRLELPDCFDIYVKDSQGNEKKIVSEGFFTE